MNRRPIFLLSCLAFGFAFFYVPILSMMVFSFNRSRLATVWGGFSTQWYERLFQDDQVINAAFLSIRIALVSATVATILGTMAGLALARFKRFRGRTLFSGFVTAPRIDAGTGLVVLAGLLVGIGTRYGSGCTSGHGVCGLSRLSPRSLVATLAFMAAGFATVFVIRHLI